MADCVVVGIDGSEAGERALEFSSTVARKLGDRLLVVHVIPWSPYAVRSAEENERRHRVRQEELLTAEKDIVDPAVARLRSEGVEPRASSGTATPRRPSAPSPASTRRRTWWWAGEARAGCARCCSGRRRATCCRSPPSQ